MNTHEATINAILKKHKADQEVYKDISAAIVASAFAAADAAASAAREVMQETTSELKTIVSLQRQILDLMKYV